MLPKVVLGVELVTGPAFASSAAQQKLLELPSPLPNLQWWLLALALSSAASDSVPAETKSWAGCSGNRWPGRQK